MKLLVGTLFIFAPASLALKAPQSMVGFHSMNTVPQNFSKIAVVKKAIENAPNFLEAAIALRRSMNGSNVIGDSLKSSTTRPENMSSFLQLQRRIKLALGKSHASTEIQGLMHFASNRLTHLVKGFGINSINVGMARSGAPWYSFVKKLVPEDDVNFDYFDNNDVKLVGSVAFFLNIRFQKDEAWRMCMAAGLGASVLFRGKFYDFNSMSGSGFGGEDFYLGFAVTDNVPGWSWSMTFNHDYVVRYLGATKVWDSAQRQNKYNKFAHQFYHLSRLSGGFEFTSAKPLKDLVAINFGYCVMGRSQGGQCADTIMDDDMEAKQEEQKELELQKERSGKLDPEHTRDLIRDAEKWSKNTVETGVGHCWCGPWEKNSNLEKWGVVHSWTR